MNVLEMVLHEISSRGNSGSIDVFVEFVEESKEGVMDVVNNRTRILENDGKEVEPLVVIHFLGPY